MAGIGFRIERLLDADSYTGTLQAYTHAALVTGGNLLSSFVCLTALVHLVKPVLGHQEMLRFQVTVTFVYCFAMLAAGPLQMALHRYLADAFYHGLTARVAPCLRGVTGLHAAVALPAGWLFFGYAGFSPLESGLAAVFFAFTVQIWMLSTFLSVCKAYEFLTASFAVSMILSALAAYRLGVAHGVAGLLAGFAAGHALLFTLIYTQVLREFPGPEGYSLRWLAWARQHGWLVVAGTLSSLGVWADKLVFWSAPSATRVTASMRFHEVYDPCMFLALLTAVPACAHFLVVLETRFYRLFRRFCAEISGGAPFDEFDRTRREMVRTLREEFVQMAKLQGAILLFMLLAAPRLLELAGIPSAYAHVLRASSAGVAAGVGMTLHVVLLLYFDLQRDAALLSGCYLVANGVFSQITVELGLRYYGYGYLGAGVVCLALALFVLDRRLGQLDFLVFRRNALASIRPPGPELTP